MALTTGDKIQAERDQVAQLKISEIARERDAYQSLLIASLDDRASPYQDKTTYPKETEGQKLEKSGQYLKDPETEVDTSQPLESKSFEIDPNKKPLTESQKRLQDKLRDRANTGQQGADLAREKLEKKGGSATDLPNFLKTVLDSKPNPLDVLKILQFLPALTGGGLGQMAGVDYSGIPNSRDLKILDAVNKYGKKDGVYQDPVKLLQNLPRV